MASRSIRVQFLPDIVANEVPANPDVHDISINDDTVGAPEILENPHVDFPGMWQRVDDDQRSTAATTDDGTRVGSGEPGVAVAAGRGDGRTDGPDAVYRYARYDAVGQTNNVRID